jgi:hypothetical protein
MNPVYPLVPCGEHGPVNLGGGSAPRSPYYGLPWGFFLMRYQRYQRQKGRYRYHCNEEVEHSMSRSGVKITVLRGRTSMDGVLLSSMSCSRNAECASSIRLYHIIGSHISTSVFRISRSSTALTPRHVNY